MSWSNFDYLQYKEWLDNACWSMTKVMPLSYFDLTYTVFLLLPFNIHIWNILVSNISNDFVVVSLYNNIYVYTIRNVCSKSRIIIWNKIKAHYTMNPNIHTCILTININQTRKYAYVTYFHFFNITRLEIGKYFWNMNSLMHIKLFFWLNPLMIFSNAMDSYPCIYPFMINDM